MLSLTTKNLYRGNLVLDLVAAVETNEDEKVMTDQVHEELGGELFNEIMALVGAKGYITQSIGATLKNEGEAHEVELAVIEEGKLESTRRAKSIYNKANRIRIDLTKEPSEK
jgi:hypothetical protein